MHADNVVENLMLKSTSSYRIVTVPIAAPAVQLCARDYRRVSLIISSPTGADALLIAPFPGLDAVGTFPSFRVNGPAFSLGGPPFISLSLMEHGGIVFNDFYALSFNAPNKILVIETFHNCPCSDNAGITPK